MIKVRDYESLCADILQWHADTFPKATLTTQLLKLEEELYELEHAQPFSEEELEERADCFIACLCLKRFKSCVGKALLEDLMPLTDDELRAVKGKFEVLKTRKWECFNGVYHHVKG